jgi:hypothetical protein
MLAKIQCMLGDVATRTLTLERMERKEQDGGINEKENGKRSTYELMGLFFEPGRVGYLPPSPTVSTRPGASSMTTCPTFNGLCKPGTKTKLGSLGGSGVGVRLYWGIGAGWNFLGFLVSVVFPRRGLAWGDVRLELEGSWSGGHRGMLRCTYHDDGDLEFEICSRFGFGGLEVAI